MNLLKPIWKRSSRPQRRAVEHPNFSFKRGQGGRGSRERQSVWCCGISFQRWRFIGRDFPGTHHTHCYMCGKLLQWPSSSLQIRRSGIKLERHRKQIERAAYHRRAEKHFEAGRNSKGLPYQRRPSISKEERDWKKMRGEMIVVTRSWDSEGFYRKEDES